MNIATMVQNQMLRARLLEIQNDMMRAQSQVSTGKKSDVYSGLRSDARTSVTLNNDKATTEAYRRSISVTKVRMETMQAALLRIGDIAIEVRNASILAESQAATASGASTAPLKALAQSRLKEIASLLNTEVDGRHLFSGIDFSAQPMIDPGKIGTAGTPLDTVASGAPALTSTATSGEARYTRIAGTTDATTAPGIVGDTTINVAGPPAGVEVGMEFTFAGHATVYTVTGVAAGQITIAGPGLTSAVAAGEAIDFYGYVDSGRPTLYYQADTSGAQVSARIDTGFDLEYGVRGDDDAIAKVMRALYAYATSDLTTTNEAGYREMSRLARADLQTGFEEVQEVIGVLGVRQSTMEQLDTRHADFLTTLQAQITSVEDVDAAEAISRLQLLQSNLEASFRLMAMTRELSLVHFL